MITNQPTIPILTHYKSNTCSAAAQCWQCCSLTAMRSPRSGPIFLPPTLHWKEVILIHHNQILWAFSIWLESVAILPQLFMLQRTGEAETITTHYLFALGLYRALYIPNWLYRYFAEGYVDQIAWVAGIVQTILYSDFFYIYYTK